MRTNTPANNPTSPLIELKLSAGLAALGQWLDQPSRFDSTIPNEVVEIVGCGDGLTPGGDDILCGALVALHTLGRQPAASILSDWIKKAGPALTSEISFAHLACASVGQGIDPLHIFIGRILDHSVQQELLVSAAQNLIHYGSSSGNYALQGALCAMKQSQR